MNELDSLRVYTWLEGGSLLLLLFVAMPLKYCFGQPLAVRLVGGLHGIAFLLFVTALLRVANVRAWPRKRTLLALASAFLPGGAFVLDRALKQQASRGQA